MIKNFVKVAVRALFHQKGYSLINLGGLAIGLACVYLIGLYSLQELTYDTYHPDHECIYRVANAVIRGGGTTTFATAPMMVGPTLKEVYPEVEAMFRLQGSRPTAVSFGDKMFFEDEDRVRHMDADVLRMLGWTFLSGNSSTALDESGSAIITEEIAAKYFGDEDPLGKVLQIGERQYQITGVIENTPSNTHIKLAIVGSWKTVENDEYMAMGWESPVNFCTYIKLAPGTDLNEFETKITSLVHQYKGEQLAERNIQSQLFLQPIADIHLRSDLTWEVEPPGSASTVYSLLAIGILVLLTGCINFVNLSTARSSLRAREVSVRKVVGGQRYQLIAQFVGESLIATVLASALGLVLADLAMPYFNALAGTQFEARMLLNTPVLFYLIGLAAFVGIGAGLYPAFLMSGYSPAVVLKGSFGSSPRGRRLRQALVVCQFTSATALLIGTLVISGQIDFMKNRDLGFDKEHKLVIELPSEVVTTESYEAVKSEFLTYPAVSGATISSSVPGRWNYQWRCYPEGEEPTNTQLVNFYQVDRDFFKEYDLEMVAGRTFGDEANGMSGGLIINEAFIGAFGWTSPEEAMTKRMWDRGTEIIGVAKSFHLKGLQTEIEPLGLFSMTEDYRYLTLKVKAPDLSGAVAAIGDIHERLFAGQPFSYFFLDDDFNRQYQQEKKVMRVVQTFASLAILISCLGLFGLVSFIAVSRTKEIGIRKVLGAPVASLISLLSRELLILVMISNLIAWPVAWYGLDRWLSNYAYHTRLEPGIFVISAIATLLIALATVSYQAIKAARANPVEALKY